MDIFAKLWYLADHAHHLQPSCEAGEAGRVERPTGQRELLLIGQIEIFACSERIVDICPWATSMLFLL